jgi:hypothetical protein
MSKRPDPCCRCERSVAICLWGETLRLLRPDLSGLAMTKQRGLLRLTGISLAMTAKKRWGSG